MLQNRRYLGEGACPTMIPPFISDIILRLIAEGFEAFIVGGAVRDMCLKRRITDWDVATSASREEIISIFRDQRKFCMRHGTVTFIDNKHHYEITSYRGGRNSTIREDLARRDFTINAMAYDISDNTVIDPFGGLKDMGKKIIRAVGNATDRFNEDPLRLLRAIRIGMELGFVIEQETMEAISRMPEALAHQSPERIREELMRILLWRRPSIGFNMLRKSGLLIYTIPELLEGYRKKQNQHHCYTIFKHIMETVDHVEPEPCMRLTALFHDIAKPFVRRKINGIFHFYGHEMEGARLTEIIMKRLKFSNAMIRKVCCLVSNHVIGYNSDWSDGAIRRFIRRVGVNNVDELIAFRRVDLIAHGFKDRKTDLLPELETRIKKIKNEKIIKGRGSLALNGNRIMELLDIEEGVEVGRIIRILFEKVTDRPELNTEPQLLRIIKQIKKGREQE